MHTKIWMFMLALVFLSATTVTTAWAEEEVNQQWIENEFEFVLVSGPDKAEVQIEDNTIKFSTPGDYIFRVQADEPDLGLFSDEQVALTLSPGEGTAKALKVLFGVEFVAGPPGGALQATQDKLAFSLPGNYTLRVAPVNQSNLITMIDGQVEMAVKSAEQVEMEFAAMAAALPDTPVEIEQINLNSAFLPMITNHHHAGHNSAEVEAATTAAIDAALADEFGAFDKRRIPVELQAWWTPAFGHVHVAVLVPLGQSVSGTINFPVRIVMHHNPSTLTQLRIDTDQGVALKVPLGNLRCAKEICVWALNVPFNTTKVGNGWREFRFRGETTAPDGKKFLSSSGIPLNVQNGSGSSNYNRFCNNTSLIGRGWYDGFGYVNAIIECVPLAPVKGVVTFRVRAQQASAALTVDLNKSHVIPAATGWPYQAAVPGRNLLTVNGNQSSWATVTVDTRQLGNGWHALAVRSDGPNGEVSKCSGCPADKNHPAGVAKMWFYVSN